MFAIKPEEGDSYGGEDWWVALPGAYDRLYQLIYTLNEIEDEERRVAGGQYLEDSRNNRLLRLRNRKPEIEAEAEKLARHIAERSYYVVKGWIDAHVSHSHPLVGSTEDDILQDERSDDDEKIEILRSHILATVKLMFSERVADVERIAKVLGVSVDDDRRYRFDLDWEEELAKMVEEATSYDDDVDVGPEMVEDLAGYLRHLIDSPEYAKARRQEVEQNHPQFEPMVDLAKRFESAGNWRDLIIPIDIARDMLHRNGSLMQDYGGFHPDVNYQPTFDAISNGAREPVWNADIRRSSESNRFVRLAMRPFREDADVRDQEAYQRLQQMTGDPRPIRHISPGQTPHLVTPYVSNEEGDAHGMAIRRRMGVHGQPESLINTMWQAVRGTDAGQMMATRKTGGGTVPHEQAHLDQEALGTSATDVRDMLGVPGDKARGFFWQFAPNEIRAQIAQVVHLLRNNPAATRPNLPDRPGYESRRWTPGEDDLDAEGNKVPPEPLPPDLNIPRKFKGPANRYVYLRSGVRDYDLVDTVLRAAKQHGWQSILDGDPKVIDEIVAQQQLSVMRRSLPEYVNEGDATAMMPKTEVRDTVERQGREAATAKIRLTELANSDKPLLRAMGTAALMGEPADIMAAQNFTHKAILRLDPKDLIIQCRDLVRLGGFGSGAGAGLGTSVRFVELAEDMARKSGQNLDDVLIAMECNIPAHAIGMFREAYGVARRDYGEDFTPEDVAGMVQCDVLNDAPNDHFLYAAIPFLVGRPGEEQKQILESHRPAVRGDATGGAG